MRTIVAHIYRLVAADLRPGALQEDATLRTKLTDWILDTLKYLQSATAGLAFLSVHHLVVTCMHPRQRHYSCAFACMCLDSA